MPNFPTLATLWHPALVRFCYRMLGSWEDAEDAASETLINAWRAWERQTFGADADAVRWLYRIARNVCLDAVRLGGRRPQSAMVIDDGLASGVSVEAIVTQGETLLEADRAFCRLSPEWRALVRCAFQGYSRKEAAAMLGISDGTAAAGLWRARAAMRRELGEVA